MFLDLLFDATRENGIYGRELDTTTMRKQFFGFGVTKGLRANPCKNRPKSPTRGKAQEIKIALLLQTGRH